RRLLWRWHVCFRLRSRFTRLHGEPLPATFTKRVTSIGFSSTSSAAYLWLIVNRWLRRRRDLDKPRFSHLPTAIDCFHDARLIDRYFTRRRVFTIEQFVI